MIQINTKFLISQQINIFIKSNNRSFEKVKLKSIWMPSTFYHVFTTMKSGRGVYFPDIYHLSKNSAKILIFLHEKPDIRNLLFQKHSVLYIPKVFRNTCSFLYFYCCLKRIRWIIFEIVTSYWVNKL